MASNDDLGQGSISVTTRSSGRRRKPVIPFDEVARIPAKTTRTSKRQPPPTPPQVTLEDYTQKQLEMLNLQEITALIPDRTAVEFTPFDNGYRHEPIALVPDDIDASDPVALLNLYLDSSIYDIVASNTNAYAVARDAITIPTPDNTRIWYPTTANEIRVLFGIFYYMGVHPEPRYQIYWETGRKDGPNHSIRRHMTLNRYEQLRRYLHVSELSQQAPIPQENEEDLLSIEPEDRLWWWKLEPLISHFRDACQRYYIPRNDVAIDEIMVRFFGRSHHTYKMPKKPIQQGYKLFALADHGYVWFFYYTSRQYGIGELVKVLDLTATGSMVYQMARQLPQIPGSFFTIYLDNYFTSIPLFRKLRAINIGAVGTTRCGAAGTEFPPLLAVLREKHCKKLPWGTLCAVAVNDVLCVGWQDNNLVLMLSTVHTVHEISDEVLRERKRPAKTSTNASIARQVFGNCAKLELAIPTIINDYNSSMNGVDLANQLRSAYETQRLSYRTWLPLFYWILDQAAINAYILATTTGTWKKNSHLDFRRELYERLLAFSERLRPSKHSDTIPHTWVVLNKRKACAWCSRLKAVRQEVKTTLSSMNNTAAMHVLRDITNTQPNKQPNKCWNACGHCGVALCKMGPCWQEWHAQ